MGKKGALWSPSKDSRVCSEHFADGRPTTQNPFPTKNLGYDSSRRELFVSPSCKRRIVEREVALVDKNNELMIDGEKESPEIYENGSSLPVASDEKNPWQHKAVHFFPLLLLFFLAALIEITEKLLHINKLKARISELEEEVGRLQKALKRKEKEMCTSKQPCHSQLLKIDHDVRFFTGIENRGLFNSLHDLIVPFINRRWKGPARIQKGKRTKSTRKLPSKDEFLLALMKLRLGLLHEDLASRFNISTTLVGEIFVTWIRGMSEVLRCMIFVPSQEKILATTPKRFKSVKNLHSILDCSEIFIETPKDLNLQAATWSTYKHHNTLKFLISVAPNSSITFISRAYTGRISDKEITIQSGYLKTVPQNMALMFDKGFNIKEECYENHIVPHVPPGRRGSSQMSCVDVARTKKVANIRILVEQVIRRLKTFAILKSELPITLISHIDDILIVCAALTNLKEPIYKS